MKHIRISTLCHTLVACLLLVQPSRQAGLLRNGNGKHGRPPIGRTTQATATRNRARQWNYYSFIPGGSDNTNLRPEGRPAACRSTWLGVGPRATMKSTSPSWTRDQMGRRRPHRARRSQPTELQTTTHQSRLAPAAEPASRRTDATVTASSPYRITQRPRARACRSTTARGVTKPKRPPRRR